MNPITLTAPAKVNLTLHITGKRADGYHELDSLIAFTDCGDRLTLTPSDSFSIVLTGPFAQKIDPTDNSVIAAAGLWTRITGRSVPYAVTLEKNLPVAAGIGGGSMDAAVFLNFLNQDADIPLLPHALELGAEMPVCLYGKAAHVRGIGEDVRPATLPPTSILLINPLQPCPTGQVFQNLAGFPMHEGVNHLLQAAIAVVPKISDILTDLKNLTGVTKVGMSGSGATCYALFETNDARDKACTYLKQKRPHDWVMTGTLSPGAQGQEKG